GIRDRNVTGVQTCALPIWGRCRRGSRGADHAHRGGDPEFLRGTRALGNHDDGEGCRMTESSKTFKRLMAALFLVIVVAFVATTKIGRALCRAREQVAQRAR